MMDTLDLVTGTENIHKIKPRECIYEIPGGPKGYGVVVGAYFARVDCLYLHSAYHIVTIHNERKTIYAKYVTLR